MKVTRADWWLPHELQPMRSARRLPYSRRLSAGQTEVLVRGLVPREMEDHWFIFEEDDVVHLYRSWTGVEAFAIQLHRVADGGAEIAEVAVNVEFARSPRRRPATRLRRSLVEVFDNTPESILDVFFDSLSATPTVAVGIPGYVYGLNVSGGDAGTASPSAPR